MSQAGGFDLNVPYPMSDLGRQVLTRFANRDRQQIAEGDMKAFGNLSAADAMEALSTGSYRGLEGVDFGTSFGRPVAKLPNGAVIQVTAGEMLAAIRKRESTRRQVVSKAVEQVNRDEFAAANEDVFESVLANAIASDQMSEETANSYRAFYKMDPMGVLAYLSGVDLADKRQAKQVEARGRNEMFRRRADVARAGMNEYLQATRRRMANQPKNQNAETAARATAISDGVISFGTTLTAGNAMERSFTPENLPTYASAVMAMSIGDVQLADALKKIGEATTGTFDPAELEDREKMVEVNVNLAMQQTNKHLQQAGLTVSPDYLRQIVLTAAGGDALPAEPATFESTLRANQKRAMTAAFEELDRDLGGDVFDGEQGEREAQVAQFITNYGRSVTGSTLSVDPANLQGAVDEMRNQGATDVLNGLVSRGLLFKDSRGNFYISQAAAMQVDMGRDRQSGTERERRDRNPGRRNQFPSDFIQGD